MGCVSSTLLSHDDHDFTQIGGSTSFGHHIVKLTSTTYGLLTLDPPPPPPPSSDHPFPSTATTTTTIIPPTPPPRFTLTSPPSADLRPPLKPDDIINSWELMAGLDSSSSSATPTPLHRSLRFSPLPATANENSNPNLPSFNKSNKTPTAGLAPTKNSSFPLDEFEKLCPPNGENKVVVYTTTLRGIRKTFEDCNAVRFALQGFGVMICERDISMDRGFRDELRELMMMMNKSRNSKNESLMIPPRLFIKGRYIGGVEEIMRIAEDGILGNLLSGLPKLRAGNDVCEGCGGARFLPCFQCNGSCKMVNVVEEETDQTHTHNSPQRTVVVRCSDCNENGLILCPICA